MPWALNQATKNDQPDQDPRIHGGRQADRLDRGCATWCSTTATSSTVAGDAGRVRGDRSGEILEPGSPATRNRGDARAVREAATLGGGTRRPTRCVRADRASAEPELDASQEKRSPRRMGSRAIPLALDDPKNLVVGGGPAGLSAALHLEDPDFLLLEKQARTGGLCRSIVQDGYTFDHAGHIFFTNDKYVDGLFRDVPARATTTSRHRESWVHLYDAYQRYPFQANLYRPAAEPWSSNACWA